MPGDRLALTVLVGREQQLVGAREQLLQLTDLLLLVRIDDVERLEVVLDVHAEPRPRLFLVLLGDVGGALRQVADVTHAGFDDEVVAEVVLDRPRLRRRLDDHEALVLSVVGHRRVTIAGPREVEYSADAPEALLQRRGPPFLAARLRPFPAPGERTRESAPRGRVRACLQPRLEPRPVASRRPALAAAVPALHGEVRALLVAAHDPAQRRGSLSRAARAA